ncbi:Protein PUF6 [Entamoeba marina]
MRRTPRENKFNNSKKMSNQTGGLKRDQPTHKNEKASDEFRRQFLAKKQKKEDNEDTITQMKYIIDSHFKAHKKWTAGDVEQLITLSSSRMFDLAIKPDSSRIIQTIIKYGDDDQRKIVTTELQPKALDLTKDQYGHYVVKKMLKYCSRKYAFKLIESYKGHVHELMMQKYSSDVLNTLCDYLNKSQQRKMIEEVYGTKYEYQKSKNPNAKSFQDVISINDTMKAVICKDLKEKIFKVLNRKQVVPNPLFSQMLVDYLSCVDEADLSEVASSIREHLLPFLKTSDGPKIMKFVVLNSSAKARKGLLKEVKEDLVTLFHDRFGHYCILYLLRHIDDKLVLNKHIISKINQMMSILLFDKYGIELIYFILDPLNTHFLPPSIVDPLKDKGKFTIKDDDVRFNDLLLEIKPTLLSVCQQEYSNLIQYKPTRRLLASVKKHFPEEVEWLKDEDLLGKKKEEVEEKEEETKPVETKPQKMIEIENDAVMEDDEKEDIEDIRKMVAEEKEQKKSQPKKTHKRKGYK